ncbi:unnamed protein product [Porites lobata]|uniref:NB-ARC domain-containing protein n=1 Tax=Porites lobata TaxID=104759 RepID=A0ABN8QCB2_9CNID|nr:unnamed protein product [Porites lobata]
MEYSQEQLNFFRLCCVVFDLVPEGLRQIFKNEWDFRYKAPLGEWKDTAQNGLDFYNNESKSSHKKNGRLLATIQNGNTAEWDCTCLFFAILYSDSIGTTLSPAVQKEVDDIRQVRNEIAHITEGKLADADFQTSVDRVLSAFTSLGLAITEVQEIKNQTNFPTTEVEKIKKQARDLQAELKQTKFDLKEKESRLQRTEADLVSTKEENRALTQEINAKFQPFCFLTSRPPHDIIKRSHDIERITNKMEELYNGAKGAVSAVYLSGNPGCGKSQLAREIGQQFYSERNDDVKELIFVATLNTESVETLADSYLTLAKHLQMTEYALKELESLKSEKPFEAIQQLHRFIIPKASKFTKWLIIVDNVIDLRLVRGLLPQTGSVEWGHGQVLITTQDSGIIPQNAPHTYHESLSKGLKLDEAVKLLETLTQISKRGREEIVAELLDFQPLALAAAAYYVQTVVNSGSLNYDWKAYLDDISTYGQRNEIESVLATESSAYSKTTMAAVEMAIKRAADVDEVLRLTFSFLSLCAKDDHPLETVSKFVKAQVKDQPQELIKAKIVKSSLLLVYSEKGNKPLTYLRLHKVVYEALKQAKTLNLKSWESDKYIAEAVKIFKSELEANGENYAFCNKLRPHCESLLNHMTSEFSLDQCTFKERFTPFVDLDIVIDWLSTIASVCLDNSYFFFAKNVVSLACNLLEGIDETDSRALTRRARIFNMSGLVYLTLGKHNQAKELHERALVIRKKIFGEDHASVATSYNNLASVYNSLGEYNQAKELQEKALVIRKKIFGEDHADVATSYNNLASVYVSLGEYNQAKKLHEKALVIRKKIFGDDHADVARIYNNLASVYNSLGEYNQAKELQEKALVIRKKIFGEDHASVATSYNNLASVYDSLGEYNQAKELHEKALVIRKKVFGEDHADVAISYNNLASVYKRLGEYNQAKELHEKALVIRKKIFGEDHADVATSYNNLASVYNSLGEYNKAKELHEKALLIGKKIFGEDHADVATSYNNLALLYNSLGEYNQAKELHEKALVICKKIFGEDHADVATSYNNLASVYDSLGEYNKAKELHEKALVICKKIFGEDHADVATSYNNLASVYDSLGEYNQAKELLEKALVICKKIFGEDHADVATSYKNLASVYDSLGEYNRAKELHEKALVIRKKVFGEDHADVATSYNDLAVVYNSLGEYNRAKELHEKALVIRKKVFGEDHADVAASYNNLAVVYNSLGEYNRAKELHEKALVIGKKVFGEDHANVATSYNNLASVYYSIGEYNRAKELHEKALVIRKKVFGEDHADVATSYNNLAVVYKRLGEYIRAKELYEKALRIYEKIFVEDHLYVERVRNNLALLNQCQRAGRCKDRREKARCLVL